MSLALPQLRKGYSFLQGCFDFAELGPLWKVNNLACPEEYQIALLRGRIDRVTGDRLRLEFFYIDAFIQFLRDQGQFAIDESEQLERSQAEGILPGGELCRDLSSPSQACRSGEAVSLQTSLVKCCAPGPREKSAPLGGWWKGGFTLSAERCLSTAAFRELRLDKIMFVIGALYSCSIFLYVY